MTEQHINEIDLALYASGYAHFGADRIMEIQEHLAVCEACGDSVERYLQEAALSDGRDRKEDDGDDADSSIAADFTGETFTKRPSHAAHMAPRWRKSAIAAAAVLMFGGLAWAGVELGGKYVQHLQEITRLRREAMDSQTRYDRAWAVLGFEKIVDPTIRVLTAESGGKPDRIRVELSPRIQEGWIRDVSVSWGDAGGTWEPVYEAQGTVKGFHAVHEYRLPPAGKTRQYTLRVLYVVPDAVAAARRLTPDQLTSVRRVEATTDGIRLVPQTGAKEVTPETAESGPAKVTWLSPSSGSEAGWRVKVTLQSPAATELVTLLVRPISGNTFYVQPGAKRLSAGTPESFDVQLGSGSEPGVGMDFDIVAVCTDSFVGKPWSLELNQVPDTAVIGRVTLHKAAGNIRVAQQKAAPRGGVDVEGEIWTSHGGALLAKENGRYKVLKTFSPSIRGNRFAESMESKQPDRNAIHLLVRREGEPELKVGQVISDLPAESWLYKCGNSNGGTQQKPSEQGE